MTTAEAKFLLDPYLDWAKREGLPVHEDAVVDLAAAETGPWPRLGERCQGGVCKWNNDPAPPQLGEPVAELVPEIVRERHGLELVHQGAEFPGVGLVAGAVEHFGAGDAADSQI